MILCAYWITRICASPADMPFSLYALLRSSVVSRASANATETSLSSGVNDELLSFSCSLAVSSAIASRLCHRSRTARVRRARLVFHRRPAPGPRERNWHSPSVHPEEVAKMILQPIFQDTLQAHTVKRIFGKIKNGPSAVLRAAHWLHIVCTAGETPKQTTSWTLSLGLWQHGFPETQTTHDNCEVPARVYFPKQPPVDTCRSSRICTHTHLHTPYGLKANLLSPSLSATNLRAVRKQSAPRTNALVSQTRGKRLQSALQVLQVLNV